MLPASPRRSVTLEMGDNEMSEHKHEEMVDDAQMRHAQELHGQAIFINGIDPTWPDRFDSEYARKLKAGGVTAINSTTTMPWDNFAGSINSLKEWYRRLDAVRGAGISQARSVSDIEECHALGRVASIFGMQTSNGIEGDKDNLRIFHELGIRIMGIAYQRRNLIADGCGESTNAGLSILGHDVIREMNRLGIVIDLSHTGERSSLEILGLSEQPVVFSHSASKALSDHSRNITDEQLDRLAEREGVVGVPAASFMLLKADEPGTFRPTSVETVLDHIDYFVRRIGADHVGVGFDVAERRTEDDYEKWTYGRFPEIFTRLKPGMFDLKFAKGLEDASKARNITLGLIRRGYSDQDIIRILGGNFIRVFRIVWGN